MKINISDEALNWFIDEMGLKAGDGVHFYGKVYGKTNVHDGFSLAMQVKKPADPEYELKLKDISFFIEHGDIWFFSGYNLNIDYDSAIDGPKYTFVDE
ncbi:HesB/YadR/YfhF family protein [Companilactobacillus sp. DQM5]|uniref:HesB/YadR/YfhF family protein n=1 Tax=Companilactobacillus sp. DQM5 TaxID=3463359 RepID=UPI004059AFBB